jgi:hypothetical protein
MVGQRACSAVRFATARGARSRSSRGRRQRAVWGRCVLQAGEQSFLLELELIEDEPLPCLIEDARSITPREALLHRIPYHAV